MEKADYLQRAPTYYALVMAIALRKGSGRYLTLRDLSGMLVGFSEPSIFSREQVSIAATKLLQKAGVVEVIHDDFGPTLYSAMDRLDHWIDSASDAAFARFRAAGQNEVWAIEAIEAVNDQYSGYYFEEGDFDTSGQEAEQEWKPLPLERSDTLLQAAKEALDTAIVQIEADNGYAVHAVGERNYVLSSLKTFRKFVREETQITAMYVKTFALEPLSLIVTRFGKAAVGVAAAAASAALVDWLKSVIARVLTG